MNDVVICFVFCVFYRQYSFFCRHMWYFHLLYDVFISHNWNRWIFMFEKNEYEIYETIIKKYVINEIYEIIDAFDKILLKVREILNIIKKRYYDLKNCTTNMNFAKRHTLIYNWLKQFKTLTSFIRKQKMKNVLRQLKKINLIMIKKRRRRNNIDNEKKKS